MIKIENNQIIYTTKEGNSITWTIEPGIAIGEQIEEVSEWIREYEQS